MVLENKVILLISPEPWDHIFVSKHHYATHLAKRGNLVFFLNPPARRDAVNKTDFEGVFSVSYSGFPKGLRFYPGFLQRYFIRERFHSLQHLCKVKFDIVWSFDNSVFFDFYALPKVVLKISHIVDLNQDFQTEKAASTADYCFCTTDLIKIRLLKFNPNVNKINHGFNKQENEVPFQALPGQSKIKALYAGNLDMPFIDWILIFKMVYGNPEVDFLFVGPNKDCFTNDILQNSAKRDVIKLVNSFFIGRIESSKLQEYQKSADILLVAYQERHQLDQANPHKMMEYLGSGKMIVATYTEEYSSLVNQKLFLMSGNNDNSEFPAVFNKALCDLEFWNSKEKLNARKSFADDNSYGKQIERIEKYLNIK